jgi:hypothetical protein
MTRGSLLSRPVGGARTITAPLGQGTPLGQLTRGRIGGSSSSLAAEHRNCLRGFPLTISSKARPAQMRHMAAVTSTTEVPTLGSLRRLGARSSAR